MTSAIHEQYNNKSLVGALVVVDKKQQDGFSQVHKHDPAGNVYLIVSDNLPYIQKGTAQIRMLQFKNAAKLELTVHDSEGEKPILTERLADYKTMSYNASAFEIHSPPPAFAPLGAWH